LKNFLADASDRERTLKRGGAHDFVPLREEQIEAAELLFRTHSDAASEDRVFERTWAEALVASGLERLSADYKVEGKEKLFQELKIFLTGGAEPLPRYADLAERLGTIESTLRSHITRLRARYREALRAEVRRTVATESEVDGELRELLRVLTRG
jgi:RNA polymerase sigma-70 factor (ECF subfamily)